MLNMTPFRPRGRDAILDGMRRFLIGAALTMVAGCTRLDSAPIQPAPLAEKDCTQAAMAAVKDAAGEDYQPNMQDVVYRNSYNACVAAKQNGASGN